jgi:hypothetical protein
MIEFISFIDWNNQKEEFLNFIETYEIGTIKKVIIFRIKIKDTKHNIIYNINENIIDENSTLTEEELLELLKIKNIKQLINYIHENCFYEKSTLLITISLNEKNIILTNETLSSGYFSFLRKITKY